MNVGTMWTPTMNHEYQPRNWYTWIINERKQLNEHETEHKNQDAAQDNKDTTEDNNAD